MTPAGALDEQPERSARGKCRGKVVYLTHADVHRMARWLRRQGVRGLVPYRCRTCKAWHIGGGSDHHKRRR